RAANADIEVTKLRVHGANFVEAHFIDQPFEDKRIVGEKIYAPFPIVKTDRSGNDLLHLASIAAAHHTVLVPLSRAFLDGKRVPVLFLATTAIHGIKAQVLAFGNVRIEPRPHGLALP